LLKENANDFEMVEGIVNEKNAISYEDSLHTKHLQRSKYLKIDDNLLNIKAMNNDALNGGISGKSKKDLPEPLSDDRIRLMKNEIRRVQVKYLKQEEVQFKRKYLLHSKIKFSTIMFNLKEKGEKLTDLCKYNNFLIRKRGCTIETRADQDWIMNNMVKRRKGHDRQISDRQVERLATLREDNKDLNKFEQLQHLID
jgi:hypothetical protein